MHGAGPYRTLRKGMSFQRMRWKIMLPYALLTLVFAALAGWGITRLVTSSLEDRLNKQLVDAGRVTSDAVVRNERQHLTTLRTIAFTDGVADAVANGDRGALGAVVQPLIVNAKADEVEILGARGQQLLATRLADPRTVSYEPIRAGEDFSQWPIVQDVLNGRQDEMGDKWAQLGTVDGVPGVYSAGPIRDTAGQLVGVVIAGTPLGTFLPTAKSDAVADVTLYDLAGRPLSTTIPDPEVLPQLAAPSGGSPGLVERKTLFGRGYEFLYGDLRLRNETVGRYSVAVATDAVTSASVRAQWLTSLGFGTLTLLALLIGWLLARNLTKPLSRLVRTARAVSSGDLSARANLHGRDEIGTLAATFDAMTERLQRQHVATIGALASAIDARDPYTAGHSVRVGELSAELGQALGLPSPALYHLRVGGILHDIGKIGVRDSVLLKPAALTPEERALIEEHPRIGLSILASADLPPEVLAIVGGHHERLNGKGYPLGLTEEELSVFPRIAAVADVYDAVTSDRPYREGMSPQDALHLLRREAEAGLIDPEVVAAMVRIAGMWEERRLSSEATARILNDAGLPRAA